MSDFDPALLDIYEAEGETFSDGGVRSHHITVIVAKELRRLYEEQGDPGAYFLIMRAQELEAL